MTQSSAPIHEIPKRSRHSPLVIPPEAYQLGRLEESFACLDS
jgi:hypothetical protein